MFDLISYKLVSRSVSQIFRALCRGDIVMIRRTCSATLFFYHCFRRSRNYTVVCTTVITAFETSPFECPSTE